MNIKEIADKLSILPSKIRYYEDQGLIDIKRDENGYRIFDDKVVEKLKIIVALKKLDFTLKDISYVMELLDLPASEDCNRKSRGYWEELIYELEEELKRKLLILKTLRNIYGLSKNHEEYQKNKDKILNELVKEGIDDE